MILIACVLCDEGLSFTQDTSDQDLEPLDAWALVGRIVDDPDEVHIMVVARREIGRD